MMFCCAVRRASRSAASALSAFTSARVRASSREKLLNTGREKFKLQEFPYARLPSPRPYTCALPLPLRLKRSDTFGRYVDFAATTLAFDELSCDSACRTGGPSAASVANMTLSIGVMGRSSVSEGFAVTRYGAPTRRVSDAL